MCCDLARQPLGLCVFKFIFKLNQSRCGQWSPLAITFSFFFFFFNDTPTPEIYPLSLHDALPIYKGRGTNFSAKDYSCRCPGCHRYLGLSRGRSEEHTSELQSLRHLVCRLLL